MTITTAAMRSKARAREIRKSRRHQVALPDWVCTDENYHIIDDFCRERFGEGPTTLSIQARWESHAVEDMRLYCFPTPEQAREFADHFDAEPFDLPMTPAPKKWHRPGLWSHRIAYGPLRVPKWLRDHP